MTTDRMRPIITAQEMLLLEENQEAELLMQEGAGEAAAIIAKTHPNSCLFIVGSGNNGADALLTGTYLLKMRIPCTAWCLKSTSEKELHRKQKARFTAAGGHIIEELPLINHPFSCCIDGLFGTGFDRPPSSEAQKAINWMNEQTAPIFAIDIPSGLNATDGTVPTSAVIADYTLTCHLPKWGLFLNQGWKYTGELMVLPLSLPKPAGSAYLIEKNDIKERMPKIERIRDKYSAGAVVGIAGSLEMPGAAALASYAALRIGAGIVRLFTPRDAISSLIHPEVIRIPLASSHITTWGKTIERSDAAFIGPGLGRDTAAAEIIAFYLPQLPQAKVIDADALFFKEQQYFSNALLTPHHGEMGQLIEQKISSITNELLITVKEWAIKRNCTLILKGAPTYIFSQTGSLFVMPRGSPGMATAGTGDVLTGILAGLLAQKLDPLDAAIVGTWLHARAGERATEKLTPYCLTASNLFDTLPEAISEQIGQ